MQKILLAGLIALTPMIALADTSTGTQTPPRPPMGSGSEMTPESTGLRMAMAQLSATDRTTLEQMIRDYLTSKGIDPTRYAEKREEIKGIKKETREAIQGARKTHTDSMKSKRMEMRNRIQDIRQNTGSGTIR